MEEKLREAACFGDLDALNALLAEGADVNGQHKINGWTPLHWAAKRNNQACVEVLLARGADKMLYTSKGELAAHLTTNKNVLQVLGYSGTLKEKRKKMEQKEKERREAENNAADKAANFVPNYLRHPQLNYKVDVEQAAVQQQSSPQLTNKQQRNSSPSSKKGGGGLSAPQVPKAKSSNSLEERPPPPPPPPPAFKILKARLVGKDEYDRDFIEIDVPTSCLTFRRLIDIVCEEFSIDAKIIIKIRKLPNTKMRRDVEVQRLKDYQELEIETIDSS